MSFNSSLCPDLLSRRLKESVSLEEAQNRSCFFENAAIAIQKIARGFLARERLATKRMPPLCEELFEKAKESIASKAVKNLPLASHGKSRVYISDLPIVLKEAGIPDNHERLQRMRVAYEICRKCSYRSLVIPNARITGDFLIESKLPIQSTEYFDQVALYLENLQLFDLPAKELTCFLLQTQLPYITHCKSLIDTYLARYDNLALYIENGEGKIGLIDIERLNTRKKKRSTLEICLEVVTFFPHHVEEVLSAAKEFDLTILEQEDELEKRSDETLEYWDVAYKDHVLFLKEMDKPVAYNKFLLPNLKKKEEIVEKMHRAFPQDSEKVPLQEFQKKYLLTILDKIYEIIRDKTRRIVATSQNPTCGEVLSLRTARGEIDAYDLFLDKKEIESFCSYFKAVSSEPSQVLRWLYESALIELANANFIASFHRNQFDILIRF